MRKMCDAAMLCMAILCMTTQAACTREPRNTVSEPPPETMAEVNTAYADRVASESANVDKWIALMERLQQAKQAASAREVLVLPVVKPLPSDVDLLLWERQGQPVTNFVEKIGQVLAHVQTFCWVRYDQEYLYVVFKCMEPNPEKLARCPIAHDGPVWDADDVELFIDPDNNKNNYYLFGSDSAGTHST